jgi:hypothetical protein
VKRTEKIQKLDIEAFGPILGSGQKSGHPRENWALGQMSSGRSPELFCQQDGPTPASFLNRFQGCTILVSTSFDVGVLQVHMHMAVRRDPPRDPQLPFRRLSIEKLALDNNLIV